MGHALAATLMLDASVGALLRARTAFQTLSLPVPGLLARLNETPAALSMRLEDPNGWLRDGEGALLPVAVRAQLGAELMHSWYHEAEGFARYPEALKVLAQHLCAIDRQPDITGPIGALELDAERGLALVRPFQALDGAWGQGVLQGALDAAGDLLFSEVQWLEDAREWRIRFVSSANRERVSWAVGQAEDAMVWRLRNRVRLLEQHNAWLQARGGVLMPAAGVSPQRWIDPLTGAVPESQLRDRLLMLTQSASPVPPSFCLLGYAAAGGASDALLQRMGRVGQAMTRRDDLLAHLGPQGMALLLVDADTATGERIAARLREKLQADTTLRTTVLGYEGGSVAAFLVKAKAALLR